MRLVFVTVAWVAGMVAAAALPGQPAAPWLALALLASAGLMLRRARREAGLALACALMLGLGGLRLALLPDTDLLSAWHGLGGMTISGTVAAHPTVRDTGVSLVVEADAITRGGATVPTRGRVLVEAAPGTNAQIGDRVRATGRLVRPAESDRFSYAEYLARRGIYSQLTQASVEVTPAAYSLLPGRWLAALREGAQQHIERALAEPYASLLSGIVLGDDSRIAPEIEAAFAATGSAHILAISGFNMVIISQVVSAGLARLGLSARRAGLLSIVFVGLYSAFVGAGPAILRAALMSSLLVAAPLVRRRAYVPASVALAMLVLSLLDPWVLWDLGFQFSVAATLGLALFAGPIGSRLDRLMARAFSGRALRLATALVSAPLAATLAAQITTAPIGLLSFGTVSLVLLPVNLLILPVQPAILLLGGLAVLVAAVFAPLAQPLFWAALLPLSWTSAVVRAFAALPFAQADIGLSPTLAALYLLLIGMTATLSASHPGWSDGLRQRVRQQTVVSISLGASALVLVIAAALALARPDGQLHVHFLDVGHSNAVLIQTPGGAQVLVDGGRLPSRLLAALGDRMPFSDSTIEALVITQPDSNEYGALASVVERYSIPLVLTNGQPNASPDWDALMQRLGGATVQPLTSGARVELSDGAWLEALNPAAPPALGDSLDDYSLTLRVGYGEVNFLLTADLSRNAQAQLASAPIPRAAVFQAPQHATAFSLDPGFFAAVQPQAVIVQAAGDNRRGDPNADVLAIFGTTPVFRTDTGGALHLWTDGRRLWINGERTLQNNAG